MCCTKWSSVINSIYSGQQLFFYIIEKMTKCGNSVGGMITFIDGKNKSLKFWVCGLTIWENVGEKSL